MSEFFLVVRGFSWKFFRMFFLGVEWLSSVSGVLLMSHCVKGVLAVVLEFSELFLEW